LILLFLKYSKESDKLRGEVGIFSILLLIALFLEKYILVVYSFSLFSKYF
jgi:hypothetical protein